MGHPALNAYFLRPSSKGNLDFQGPQYMTSSPLLAVSLGTVCHTRTAACPGHRGPDMPRYLPPMFSFPTENWEIGWEIGYSPQGISWSTYTYLEPSTCEMGSRLWLHVFPQLGLYLIHLTSPKPTMLPHRQKNIWGWSVPHTHAVCTNASKARHTLVSTLC